MSDPYTILGVAKNSSQEDIKKSYRKLVKQFHPDLNPGNKKAEEKFKNISQAYDLIGTPENRAKYDRGETEEQEADRWQNAGPRRQTSRGRSERYAQSFADQFGTEDFFNEFFKSQRAEKFKADRDTHYEMVIGFRDSIIGGEKVINLPNGKNLKISIPPGISSGTKLRFKNQGVQATSGTEHGDAIITINVEPLEGWERIGLDLITEIPISFIEAILGAEISVNTMYGPVMLKIPEGVNTGSKLRIKGKGVKKGTETGNQIVQLKIVLPKKISPQLKEAVANWKGAFDYNPRESSFNERKHHRQTTEERRGEI